MPETAEFNSEHHDSGAGNVPLMTRREYAISLGLAKPGRGRMSREAHAALAEAKAKGMSFDDAAPVKPQRTEPQKAETPQPSNVVAKPRPPRKPQPVRAKPETPPVRDETRAYIVRGRAVIEFRECGYCRKPVAYCQCDQIHAPTYFTDADVTLERPVLV